MATGLIGLQLFLKSPSAVRVGEIIGYYSAVYLNKQQVLVN